MARSRTRTTPGLRVKRFAAKWSPKLTGRRFKYQVRSDQWGLYYNILEDLVAAADEQLVQRGVPSEVWPYYEGMVYRASARVEKYTGKMLATVLDELVEEFTLRDLDPAVVFEMVGLGAILEPWAHGGARIDFSKKDVAWLDVHPYWHFYADCCCSDYAYCCSVN